MHMIINLVLMGCVIIGFIALSEDLKYLKSYIKKEDAEPGLFQYYKRKPVLLTILLIIAILVLVIVPIYNYVSATPDGLYCYNVIVENIDSEKYTLPASIYCYTEIDGETRYSIWTQNDSTTINYNKRFFIERAYWPNGGYLNFDDHEIEPLVTTRLYDQEDREWNCTLTMVESSNPNIQEDVEKQPVYDIIIGVVCAISTIICLSLYILKLSK